MSTTTAPSGSPSNSPADSPTDPEAAVRETLDRLYHTDSRRIFATLVRLLGDFDRAEEALHEAFRIALERWPRDGVPDRPRAWLISAGRFRAIDGIRRDRRWSSLDGGEGARDGSLAGSLADSLADALADHGPDGIPEPIDLERIDLRRSGLEDDRLRLIFTCCHPALSADAQVALTLREVCGLTTEEIARAFLVPVPTLAQRIVRAKGKIRDAGIPYRVPGAAELPGRLEAVLRVVYLVFNEGYSASSGEAVVRADLSGEAIRLGRLLAELLPHPETLGLLALMLLHDARREARTSPEGEVVRLQDQDRSRWDRARIAEGTALVERALASGGFGAYGVQAAISAVHAEAPDLEATDWAQIVGLYDVLLRLEPSPVVELNRAMAVAMAGTTDQGPGRGRERGLELIEAILARGDLEDYALAHAARADLLERLERRDEARASYRRAIDLTPEGPSRRLLEERLAGL